MRKELKSRGVKKLKVIYSKEEPIKQDEILKDEVMKAENIKKKQVPGSISFVPSVAGLMIAGEVIRNLIK